MWKGFLALGFVWVWKSARIQKIYVYRKEINFVLNNVL